MGRTFQQIQKYEGGIDRVDADEIGELAILYKVPVQWLIHGDRENEQDQALVAARVLQALDKLPSQGGRLSLVKLVEAAVNATEPA